MDITISFPNELAVHPLKIERFMDGFMTAIVKYDAVFFIWPVRPQFPFKILYSVLRSMRLASKSTIATHTVTLSWWLLLSFFENQSVACRQGQSEFPTRRVGAV